MRWLCACLAHTAAACSAHPTTPFCQPYHPALGTIRPTTDAAVAGDATASPPCPVALPAAAVACLPVAARAARSYSAATDTASQPTTTSVNALAALAASP